MLLSRAGSRVMSRHPSGDARSSRGLLAPPRQDGGVGHADSHQAGPSGPVPGAFPNSRKKGLFWSLFLLFCFYFSFLFSKYTCHMFFLVFIIKDI